MKSFSLSGRAVTSQINVNFKIITVFAMSCTKRNYFALPYLLYRGRVQRSASRFSNSSLACERNFCNYFNNYRFFTKLAQTLADRGMRPEIHGIDVKSPKHISVSACVYFNATEIFFRKWQLINRISCLSLHCEKHNNTNETVRHVAFRSRSFSCCLALLDCVVADNIYSILP